MVLDDQLTVLVAISVLLLVVKVDGLETVLLSNGRSGLDGALVGILHVEG